MVDGSSAPATKKDISLLMEEFGKMWEWKEDVEWRFNDLEDKMERWKKEVKDHFDLVAENIRHDFASANREEIDVLKDRSNGHEKRIVRLERAAGVAA